MADQPVTFEELVGDIPVACGRRGKAGRPAFIEPQDFTSALAALSPPHAEFARGVVAGLTQEQAYRAAYPSANVNTGRSNGKRLAQNKGIAAAIRLGRDEMAKELRVAVKYQLEEAHREIDRHIAGAVAASQWNAVASLVREKLKLHKLVDNRDSATAQSGFSIIINSADGSTRVVGAEDSAPKAVADGTQPIG